MLIKRFCRRSTTYEIKEVEPFSTLRSLGSVVDEQLQHIVLEQPVAALAGCRTTGSSQYFLRISNIVLRYRPRLHTVWSVADEDHQENTGLARRARASGHLRRWKVIIHYVLLDGLQRTCKLEKRIAGISQKVLIEQLRALKKHGMVSRQPSERRA